MAQIMVLIQYITSKIILEKEVSMTEEANILKQKIFLSYAHKVDGNPDHTADLVDAIKQRLEMAGHEAWIDKQQLCPGKDWREGITQGIDESDRVLSFLSSRSVRDPGVCLDEIGIAMSHKHGAIATLLADRDIENRIPASVAHVQYLDVSDWQTIKQKGQFGWDIWLEEITQKILQIIAANQGFAGEIEELKKVLTPMPDTAKLGKLIEHGLIGRKWVKDAISDWRLNKLGQRMFWLMGGAGMGKSAIAADLVHKSKLQAVAYHFCDYQVPESRTAHTFVTNLAFMLATRLPDYRRLLNGNIQALPKPVMDMSATELMERLVINPLRNRIDGGLNSDRLLVVVDALDEAEPDLIDLLAKYLDSMPKWLGFVVTTRPDVKAALARYPALEIRMDDIRNEDDLRAYLNNWQENDPDAHLDLGTQSSLISASQGNMLYLVLAKEGYSAGIFSLNNPYQLPQGIGAVFLEWMKRQFGGSPLTNPIWKEHCYPLLELLCATPEPLPQSIAGSLLKWKGQNRIQALRPLGSLISEDSETFRLCHRSLGDWLSDPENINDYWVNRSDGRFQLVQNLLPLIPSNLDVAEPNYIHRALPHLFNDLDREQSDELIQNSPKSTLDLIERLNDYWDKYPNTRAWQLQTTLLSWIIQQRNVHQGNNHLDTIASIFKLGNTLYSQGAYIQARNHHEQAYLMRLKDLGPDHIDTLNAMSCFARSLYAIGQYAEAKSLQEQELNLQQLAFAQDSSQLLIAKSNLARTSYAQGNYATSKELHNQVLDIQTKTLGEDHVNTVSSMSYLSSALYALGECEEAQILNSKVLFIRKKTLGNKHPNTLTSASYLASTMYTLGNYESAKNLQELVYNQRQNILGDLHPDTLSSRGSLALTLRSQGKFEEAQFLQEEVVQKMTEVLGNNHPSTLFQMSFLADTLYNLGDYSRAKNFQDLVLQRRSKVLGAEHPDSLVAAANLALTLSSEGFYENAKIMQCHVVRLMEKVLGKFHPDSLFSLRILANILRRQGDIKGCDSIYEYLNSVDKSQLNKCPVHYTNTCII